MIKTKRIHKVIKDACMLCDYFNQDFKETPNSKIKFPMNQNFKYLKNVYI